MVFAHQIIFSTNSLTTSSFIDCLAPKFHKFLLGLYDKNPFPDSTLRRFFQICSPLFSLSYKNILITRMILYYNTKQQKSTEQIEYLFCTFPSISTLVTPLQMNIYQCVSNICGTSPSASPTARILLFTFVTLPIVIIILVSFPFTASLCYFLSDKHILFSTLFTVSEIETLH